MHPRAHIDFNPRRHFSKWIRIGLPLLALALLWILHQLVPVVFSSLVVSIGLYYILNPAVDRLETRGMRRGFACATVLLGLIIVLMGVTMRFAAFSADIRAKLDVDVFQKNLVHTITQVLVRAEEEMPFLRRVIEPKGDPQEMLPPPPMESGTRRGSKVRLPESVPAVPVKFKSLSERIDEQVQKALVELLTFFAKKAANLAPNLVLIPYFTFFFLKDGRSFRKTVIEWIPNRYFEPALKFFYELDRRMRAYLQSLLLDCVLVGLLMTLGCFIIGVPYPTVMGVIAMLLNSIPLLGRLAYGSLGLLITIGVGSTPDIILGYGMVFALSWACDDFIFQPAIYGKSAHLHPVMVVAAVFVGESVAGVWGMFLCIPILSILLLGMGIIREISRGEDPAPIPAWAFMPYA